MYLNDLDPVVLDALNKMYLQMQDLKNEIYTARSNGMDFSDLIDELKVLGKKYRILRSKYDVLYFAYEYFSFDKNPENENNLIPEGIIYDNAPQFHQELCGILNSLYYEPTSKIGWSVPRGHGKSAYLSNVYPVHQIVFNQRKYILIVSETERMAQRFVEWVGDQLKFNQKLRDDFGDLLSPNNRSNIADNVEGFVSHNNIKVQSASIGKQLRGARHGAFRPDLVILDDLESAKNTNTKELREKNLHWFNSVIIPIGDITRTAYIYMGTLVHGQGLLPNVLNRSDFKGKIYSAIVSEPNHPELWEELENILRNVDDPNRGEKADMFYYENKEKMDQGVKTLWNERFTYYDLIKIKVNVGSKAFASEYLNKPSDDDSAIFKTDYFQYFDDKDLYYGNKKINMDIFGFWDIAIGKNSRSDYNAIVIIGRDKKTGVIYVLDAWAEKIPMHKALNVAYDKIAKWKPKQFGVETVQAQYDMYRQLRELCVAKGIYSTRVLSVNPKGKKEDRIENLEPLVEGGYIRFKKSQRLLIEMLELFPTHDHDDLPDALASAVEMSGRLFRKRVHYRKPEGY